MSRQWIGGMNRKWGFLAAGIVMISVMGIVVVSLNDHTMVPKEQDQNIPGVSAMNWQNNGAKDRRIVKIIEGHLVAPAQGVVLTDTRCNPDAQGLSHCHNVIRLKNHQTTKVIDTHNRMHYGCLRIDESVSVTSLGASWARVTAKSD